MKNWKITSRIWGILILALVVGVFAGVRSLVEEVNQGGQEQAHGIQEIARAVSEMQRVTQQSAAGSEQAAAAGEELNAQAETMKEIVVRLAVLIDGDRAIQTH